MSQPKEMKGSSRPRGLQGMYCHLTAMLFRKTPGCPNGQEQPLLAEWAERGRQGGYGHTRRAYMCDRIDVSGPRAPKGCMAREGGHDISHPRRKARSEKSQFWGLSPSAFGDFLFVCFWSCIPSKKKW